MDEEEKDNNELMLSPDSQSRCARLRLRLSDADGEFVDARLDDIVPSARIRLC